MPAGFGNEVGGSGHLSRRPRRAGDNVVTFMDFGEVRAVLGETPYTSASDGRRLYDFIRANPGECLELGFAHGVSSCYIAAGLEAAGAGHLTTVDLPGDIREPSIEQFLGKLGLEHRVTVVRQPGGYNWFLKAAIERATNGAECTPRYDFCFIDGAKNWTIDAAAFFLVDKLLRNGGWLLFDDYGWTYDAWASGRQTEDCDGVAISSLSPEERSQAHIERIFRLLVIPHPDYGDFRIENDRWAWAKKVAVEHKRITVSEELRLGTRIARMLKSAGRRLR